MVKGTISIYSSSCGNSVFRILQEVGAEINVSVVLRPTLLNLITIMLFTC